MLINYDAPWNPASLMQRAGRINRIGTSYETIYVYQFKPSSKGDEVLKLNQTIYNKAQMFHNILGEDSPVYSVSEQTGREGIYELQKEEEEISESTEFLADIIELYQKIPKKFEYIEKLGPKKRVILRAEDGEMESYFYLKQQVIIESNNRQTYEEVQDYFYYVHGDGKVEEKDFIDMARRLKYLIKRPKEALKEAKDIHFEHFKKVQQKHEQNRDGANPIKSLDDKSKDIEDACRRIRLEASLSKEEKCTLIEHTKKGRLEKVLKDITMGKVNLLELFNKIQQFPKDENHSGEPYYPPPYVQLSFTVHNRNRKYQNSNTMEDAQ